MCDELIHTLDDLVLKILFTHIIDTHIDLIDNTTERQTHIYILYVEIIKKMFKCSKRGICMKCDELIHTLDDLVLRKDMKGLIVFFALVFVRF